MMKPTTIQTYLFDRTSWRVATAKEWLRKHRKVPLVIVEGHYLHARQIEPNLFDRRSFRTIVLDQALGIKAVVGHLHSSSKASGR